MKCRDCDEPQAATAPREKVVRVLNDLPAWYFAGAFGGGVGRGSMRSLRRNSSIVVVSEEPEAPSGLVPTIFELTGSARTNADSASWRDLFTIPVEAGKEYEIEALLKALQSSTSDGIKYRVTAPAGATVGLWTDLQIRGDAISSSATRLFATADNAVSSANFAASATRMAHRLVVAVSNPTTAGNVVIQFARTGAAGTATIDVGSKAVAREVTIVRLADDVDVSSNVDFENILSAALDADKVYLARWLLGVSSGAETTGVKVQTSGMPSGATALRGGLHTPASGTAARGYAARNGAVVTGDALRSGAVAMILDEVIVNGENTGTITLQGASEVNTSEVSFLAGSVLILREVSADVRGSAEEVVDGAYETVRSLALSPDAHYFILACDSWQQEFSGGRITTQLASIPQDAVVWYFYSQIATTSYAMSTYNRVDGTAHGEGGSTGGNVDTGNMTVGFLYSGDGGTAVWQGSGNGAGSTARHAAGSWQVLEECEYIAVAA